MSGLRLEVMNHLEGYASKAVPTLTMESEDYWQPADFLPDMSQPDWAEQVQALQDRSAGLSDDLIVVLIGDMITEEALPNYSGWLHQLDGMGKNGEPPNAWGDWSRKWSAEENRHGDLLNKFLYLTGRVNMRAVEITIQNLLRDGAELGFGADAYKTFAYTSFQEIATRVSHRNVALQANKAGDKMLANMCGQIAADEQRHATAYKGFFQQFLNVDTDNAIIAFYEMMQHKVTMPAMNMREGGLNRGETFDKFAYVAENIGVYTPSDYTDILQHLIEFWDISNLSGLGDKAEAAQQYLCKLPDRYRRVADRFANRKEEKEYTFSWLEMVDAAPRPIPESA